MRSGLDRQDRPGILTQNVWLEKYNKNHYIGIKVINYLKLYILLIIWQLTILKKALAFYIIA